MSSGASGMPKPRSDIVSYDVKSKAKRSSYPRKQSRKATAIKVKATLPHKKQELIKWYGWGYIDSNFASVDHVTTFTGDRYPISGTKLPNMNSYIHEIVGVSVGTDYAPEEIVEPKEEDYPLSILTESQIESIRSLGVEVSLEGMDRFIRSQGQGMPDAFFLRNKIMERIPDAVVWPTCHEDVEKIIEIADAENIVIIPVGGGTSVAGALDCPLEEMRPIISLDMGLMNEILDLDPINMTATCETGIVGQDLERALQSKGFTSGHDPDSSEFSTLGGWISTRASGMKRNKYGNIEDILLSARLVTPRGTIERQSMAPRVSVGPDFNHLILGSEGIFGVITEATIRIRAAPELVHYGSILFKDFNTGIDCMRELAHKKLQSASLRLLDHDQFAFGMALRTELGPFKEFIEKLKLMYLKYSKGFNPDTMCMATLVYEGDTIDVMEHEKKVNVVAIKHGGIPAGGKNGKGGYMMTFVIAYIRDVCIEFNIFGDSLETSFPWSEIKNAAAQLRSTIQKECAAMGVIKCSIMFRVAQVYDAGGCLYIYYSFPYPAGRDKVSLYAHFQDLLRTQAIALGGAVSHHHGVGKHRRQYYEKFVSTPAARILRAAKYELDPGNVFGASNFLEDLTTGNSKSPSKL